MPSAAPIAPHATTAPDPMLAQLLTNDTPAPAPVEASVVETKTDVPPPNEEGDEREEDAHGTDGREPAEPEMPRDEEKTRPGKIAQLVEEQAVAHAHASTTVAAPPNKEAPPPPVVPPAPKPLTDNAVTSVADRDALLARLRERPASMSDDKRNAILNKPR